MISAFSTNSHLNRLLVSGQKRFMSAASTASIKSRFETAYEERIKALKKVSHKK